MGAGDASCAEGHTGPLCDVCIKEPLYYGGRGSACKLCSEQGDPAVTIALAAALFAALLVALAVGVLCFQKRTMGLLTQVAVKLESDDAFDGATDVAREAKSRQRTTTRSGPAANESGDDKKPSRLSRMGAFAARLGVKGRILISLAQVHLSLFHQAPSIGSPSAVRCDHLPARALSALGTSMA